MSVPEVDEALARAFARSSRPSGTGRSQPHFSLHTRPNTKVAPTWHWPEVVDALEGGESARFDALASRLDDACRAHHYKSVLCTSAYRAEGRTTLSLALAKAAARLRGRTLLVDADLRAPSLARRLGKEVRVGIDDVVAGRGALAEALIATMDGALGILPMRWPVARPREFLASAGWLCTMTKLRREYDRVILDGGPLFSGVSAALFQRSVDAALLIYRRGSDSERTMRHAREVLDAAKLPLLGLAENFA